MVVGSPLGGRIAAQVGPGPPIVFGLAMMPMNLAAMAVGAVRGRGPRALRGWRIEHVEGAQGDNRDCKQPRDDLTTVWVVK